MSVVFAAGRRRKADVDLILAQQECRDRHVDRNDRARRSRSGRLCGEVHVQDPVVVRDPNLALHRKDVGNVHLGVARGISGLVGGNNIKSAGIVFGRKGSVRAGVGWAKVGIQLDDNGTMDAAGAVHTKCSSCVVQGVDTLGVNVNEEGNAIGTSANTGAVDDSVGDVVFVVSLEGVVGGVVEGNGCKGRSRLHGIFARQLETTVGTPLSITVESKVQIAEIHTRWSLGCCCRYSRWNFHLSGCNAGDAQEDKCR